MIDTVLDPICKNSGGYDASAWPVLAPRGKAGIWTTAEDDLLWLGIIRCVDVAACSNRICSTLNKAHWTGKVVCPAHIWRNHLSICKCSNAHNMLASVLAGLACTYVVIHAVMEPSLSKLRCWHTIVW